MCMDLVVEIDKREQASTVWTFGADVLIVSLHLAR